MVNVIQMLLEYHDKNERNKDLSLRRIVPNIKKKDYIRNVGKIGRQVAWSC